MAIFEIFKIFNTDLVIILLDIFALKFLVGNESFKFSSARGIFEFNFNISFKSNYVIE